ncbi:MAG: hypothetical protein IPH45_01860 [Bacteroidales bacterium]|nr:hypothetical protein [Bacteroidales bacterium]
MLILPSNSISQKLEVKAGFGNYEGFNIGLNHNFNKYRLEYGLGSDLNVFGQGYSFSAHISGSKIILGGRTIAGNPVYLNLKAIAWNLSNKSNTFSAVSLSAEAFYKMKINELFSLGTFCGIAWSSVFRFERKNYQDVGFIKEWQPNFGFTLYRKLR